jgi:uncharacterized membrane protein YccC
MTEEPNPPGADLATPARRRVDPLLLVLAGVAVGVTMAATHHPQPGMFVVASAFALGAVLRLVLRPRAAGSLVVRSRQVDVLVLVTLAVTIGVIAVVTPFPAGN